MLAVDASVAFKACQVEGGFGVFGSERLVAPPLLWSECRSAFHEALWRREISADDARRFLARLEAAPIACRRPKRLGAEAWRIADRFGWARTYDAEYLALASLLGCRLVTTDERMRRGTARLGFVIGPTEI